MSHPDRRLVESLVWWAGTTAGYLVLVSTVTRAEILLGMVLSGLTTAVAVLAIGPFRPAAPPRRARWAGLAWLPVDVAGDAARLVGLVLRAGAGDGRHLGREEDAVVRRAHPGDDPAAARTYAVLLVSSSPGSYVERVEEVPGARTRLVVHRIGRRGRCEGVLVP